MQTCYSPSPVSFQVILTNISHTFLRVCPPSLPMTLELTDRVGEMPVDFVAQQISLCSLMLDNIIQPLTQSCALSTETW